MDDIDRFLIEDLGKEGDITSNALFRNETATAIIIAKEDCIIAGLEEIQKIFKKIGAQIKLRAHDGDCIAKNTTVAEIQGPIRSILKGERLALNMMGRMSGIATETNNIVKICQEINQKVTIASTRKTTPGFRKYEKKAVVLGGGELHRFGLYDAVIIKDNHLKMVDSVDNAIKTVQRKIHKKVIEIEVENEKDALTAARLNVDVIMLDNIQPKKAKEIVNKIRREKPHVCIEISGGITRKNIKEYASFADRISIGYLTHSIKSKDFSLEINNF
jgi:nicotinate-nucleotide pyrophosphorylase (carboxylating)